MLQNVFYWVFNMSITATITGLLVVLIRAVKRIPRRVSVFLWLIPFLRMVIPIGINTPYSLMALLSDFATKTVVVYETPYKTSFSMTNHAMAADTYFPITYKENVLEKVFGVSSVVWIAVAAVILLMFAAVYFLSMRNIKDASHLRDNIYLSDKAESAAVYGILKPKIVLPAFFEGRDTELVLLHEKSHIRHGDNLWRLLAIFIVAVHWFNPFCWIFLKLFLSDLEMSCDERVIAKLGDNRAKEYALFLLESKEKTRVAVSTFGGAKIRKRIENILSFKKMTRFSFLLFAVLIGAIFYVLLTNAG